MEILKSDMKVIKILSPYKNSFYFAITDINKGSIYVLKILVADNK
jgi:hypothetical protein